MSGQEERIAHSLKRLGFRLGKGRGKGFKVTTEAGGAVPRTTDAMTLVEVERWIADHIKPKRSAGP
jgi:hypothetical protein